jgi:hypothetical protein
MEFNSGFKGLNTQINCDGRVDLKTLGKSKGKAIPLEAWTGPEGSRKLRLQDFKTIDT